jgi:hypothetical protein
VKTGAAEIVLATGSDGLGAWGLFLFRIAKARTGRRVLEVNPYGAAGPVIAGPLAGSRGSFGFTIGLGRP